LDGIEAYYPSHSHSDIVNLLALAKKYDLIATGGTDYHGAIRNISPGSVRWSPDVKTSRALGLK
ncbi:MAG: hypothetical protein K2I79_02170, partial [Clostridia bacterium]|nr:hypothetical protein [Clostridia bacterium]